MGVTALELKFLEEFLISRPNKRDHTPKTLTNLLKRKWIVPDGFDDENFPLYVTADLGPRTVTLGQNNPSRSMRFFFFERCQTTPGKPFSGTSGSPV